MNTNYCLQYPRVDNQTFVSRFPYKKALYNANSSIAYECLDYLPKVDMSPAWRAALISLYAAMIAKYRKSWWPECRSYPILMTDPFEESFHEIEKDLQQTFPSHFKVTLRIIRAAKQIVYALAQGYSPIMGGSAYEGLKNAVEQKTVSMPRAGERLLGGQLFNLTEFKPEDNQFAVIAHALYSDIELQPIAMSGSYVKNLDINHDFYVVTLEEVR